MANSLRSAARAAHGLSIAGQVRFRNQLWNVVVAVLVLVAFLVVSVGAVRP
jgi:hypothetical protein